MTKMITPFLWFDGQAEEAAKFYVSIFENGRIHNVSRNSDSAEAPGSAMVVRFEVEGQEFVALNGGPEFSFTPAVSFMIDCKTQAEVDSFWERLCEGGRPGQCGWLQDKYGLSWQVVPSRMSELLQDDNEDKADAVMQAMLKMNKLDIGQLQDAYDRA